MGKEPIYNVGDLGSIHGLGRSPGGGHGNPLQYSCLENPHGQRSLVGCSPGVAESDRTGRLSTHIVDLQYCVSFSCTACVYIYMCVYILFQILFSYRLL